MTLTSQWSSWNEKPHQNLWRDTHEGFSPCIFHFDSLKGKCHLLNVRVRGNFSFTWKENIATVISCQTLRNCYKTMNTYNITMPLYRWCTALHDKKIHIESAGWPGTLLLQGEHCSLNSDLLDLARVLIYTAKRSRVSGITELGTL